MKRRVLSWALAATMVLSMLPSLQPHAAAAETTLATGENNCVYYENGVVTARANPGKESRTVYLFAYNQEPSADAFGDANSLSVMKVGVEDYEKLWPADDSNPDAKPMEYKTDWEFTEGTGSASVTLSDLPDGTWGFCSWDGSQTDVRAKSTEFFNVADGEIVTPPEITAIGAQTWTVGTAVSLQVEATANSAKTMVYSATGLPAGLTISASGLISGTPTTADTGSATVTVNKDTALTDSDTFSWIVNKGQVVFTATGDTQSAYKGVAVNVASLVSVTVGGKALDSKKYEIAYSGADVTDNGNGTVTFGASGDGKTVTATLTLKDTANYAEPTQKTKTITFDVKAGQPNTITWDGTVPQATETVTYKTGLTVTHGAHAVKGNVTFESSDPSVATVDSQGTVTVLKAGETTIKVTSADTTSDAGVPLLKDEKSYKLKVEKNTAELIVESAKQDAYVNVSFDVAKLVQVKLEGQVADPSTYELSYAKGANATGTLEGSKMTFTAEYDGAVITVTATLKGAAADRYSWTGGDGSAVKTADATFKVTNGVPNTVTWDDDELEANKTVTKTFGDENFTFTASSANANPVDYSVAAGSDVASVDAQTGEVTILKAGTATIRATSRANMDNTPPWLSATSDYTLTVNQATPEVNFEKMSQTAGSVTEPTFTLKPVSGLAGDEDAFVMEYQYTYRVAANDCDCGAGDLLGHLPDCKLVTDGPAVCTCDGGAENHDSTGNPGCPYTPDDCACTCAAEGAALPAAITADLVHASDCARVTDPAHAAHCDCGIGNAVAEADHAEGCARTYSDLTDWYTWDDVVVNGQTMGEIITAAAGGSKFDARVHNNNTAGVNYAAVDPDHLPEGFTATLNISSAYTPGGGGATTYTVTYDAGEHGKLAEGAAAKEQVERNAMPKKVPGIVAEDGWKFIGWTLDGKTVVPAETKITASVKFVAAYEQITSHAAYVKGVGEGQFAPLNSMSRAEAAAMLARLTDGFEDKAYENTFSDVAEGQWYYNYVTFAAGKGIITGYEGGAFRPEQKVTREEFAAMLCRFMGIEKIAGASKFSDVAADNWAAGYINALAQAGVVEGYEDGTFRALREITRAEAVKMINVAIGRAPDKALMAANAAEIVNPFSDVATDYWAYYDVLEAAVEHDIPLFHTAEKPAE